MKISAIYLFCLVSSGYAQVAPAPSFGFVRATLPRIFPSYCTLGDFNGDGTPDIGFGEGAPRVGVVLNDGRGVFSQPVYSEIPSDPAINHTVRIVKAVDLNGDGKSDLITYNDGQSLDVLLANGDGTFKYGANYKIPVNGFGGPAAFVLADFNGDGRPDLAIANNRDDTVDIMLGNGNGTFRPPISYPVGHIDYLVSGDFNSDGKPDLISATFDFNFPSGEVFSLLVGAGDGSFAPATQFRAQLGIAQVYGVAAADLNGDGALDLVTLNYQGPNSSVSVYVSGGDGTFAEPVVYHLASSLSASVGALAIADVTADGIPDVVVGDTGSLFSGSLPSPPPTSNSGAFQVLPGNGDGTLHPQLDM